MKETIGWISGLLVIVSVIPYAIRVYRREIPANLVSWSIWSVIGLALLLTYKSSGAKDNLWPTIFGFTNPCLITILAYWRGEKKRPDRLEIACVIIATLSIIGWGFVRDNPHLAQYALYLAMIADLCAGTPIGLAAWEKPTEDRPFMWFFFGLGYGLTIFAIKEHTLANDLLPSYMFIMCTIVSLPLIRYRWQKRLPIQEWV